MVSYLEKLYCITYSIYGVEIYVYIYIILYILRQYTNPPYSFIWISHNPLNPNTKKLLTPLQYLLLKCVCKNHIILNNYCICACYNKL